MSRRDETVKQKWKIRSNNLDKRFNKKDVEQMIFTDEKDFMIEVVRNHQNDVVYGHKKKDLPVGRLYHETSRFSKKVMLSAGVSMKERQGFILLIHPKRRLTMNVISNCWTIIFYQTVTRFIQIMTLPFNKMGLRLTQVGQHKKEHLDANTPVFIGKDYWPPQSPDLNPIDYHVWDSLSEKVYEGRKRFAS